MRKSVCIGVVCVVMGIGTTVVACGGGDGGATIGGTSDLDAAPSNDATTSDSGGRKDANTGASDATGDTSDSGGSVDSSVDSALRTDSGSTGGDAGTDAAPTDAGVDAACSPLNSACSNGAAKGLCKSSACSPCTDTSDDALCTAAYGNGNTQYICNQGACTAGCRTDSNCPLGLLCSASHQCVKCATDVQCQAASYGAGSMCQTVGGAGTCVANTCTVSSAACAQNPSDVCCAAATGNACVPGTCCTDAGCVGSPSTPFCVSNTCSRCDAVSSSTYYVDPIGGADVAYTTGSGAVAGQPNARCAFKTVRAALNAATANGAVTPPTGTQIVIRGNPVVISTASNGESFPLSVPRNVVVRGESTNPAAVTIKVASAATGFRIASPSSGLQNLTIDGASGGIYGVLATTGSVQSSALSNVMITDFAEEGIRVDGTGALTITGGTQSNNNGSVIVTRSGLHVTNNAVAYVSGGTNGAPTAFKNNSEHGILVDGSGSIVVTGTPSGSAPNVGTVIVSGNQADGVYIKQDPSGTAPPNSIDGLVVWGSGAQGIEVYSSSALSLRRSLVLNNGNNGVLVASNASAASVDLSRLDLGVLSASWGANVLQASGASANQDTGICLAVPASSAVTLRAAGNIFATANCATTSSTLTRSACGGGAQVDVGILLPGSGIIDTRNCSN